MSFLRFVPTVLLLAGCSSAVDELLPVLTIMNIEYEDLACEDALPVTFRVQNIGEGTAMNVVASVRGGTQTASSDLGDLAPQGVRDVRITSQIEDTCFIDDYYTMTAEVDASNSVAVRERFEVNT